MRKREHHHKQKSALMVFCFVAFLFSQTTFASTKIFVHGRVVNNIQQPIGNIGVLVHYNTLNSSTTTDTSGIFKLSFSIVAVKQQSNTTPTDWKISANYPNPFNPSTNIEFSLPLDSHVIMKIYDLRGREIGSFVEKDFNAGNYKTTLELNGLSNGVYIAMMQAKDFNGEVHSSVQKLLLLYGSQHNTNPVEESVKVGETNANYSSIQTQQQLSKESSTSIIDSVVVSGTGITRTKFTDIPVNSDSVNLGDLVVNSAPRQTSQIPNLTLREDLDSMDVDLNGFISNDNATVYSSQNPKITVVGSHARFNPDSSDISGSYLVAAIDSADASLFVYLVIPVLVQHPNKLIVGPVYDLFTKYSGKTPIAGMKVYLGSDTSNNALTDAEGMAFLKTFKTGKNSVFVVGATRADTAFYFWHNDRLNIVAGDNAIKAFNDSSGIPTWQRFQDENGDDALDFVINMGNIINSPTLNHPIMGDYVRTLPRFRDEDMPAKVWMGRDKDPTGGRYADSIWRGMKTQENSKLKFVEVADSASAIVHIFYTNANYENGIHISFNNDAKGPYLSNFDLNFSGPPGSQTPATQIYTSHLAAHGISRAIIFAVDISSHYMKDILFSNTVMRYDSGIRDFASEKERRVFETHFLLERNPKLLDYFR
jgi:hypothetical protein